VQAGGQISRLLSKVLWALRLLPLAALAASMCSPL